MLSFGIRRTKLSAQKVEERVILRMNRRWMAHMRLWYPEAAQLMMHLTRAAHSALHPNDDSAAL